MQQYITKLIEVWVQTLCKGAIHSNEQFQLSREEITVVLCILILLAVAVGITVLWIAFRLVCALPRPSASILSKLLESIITAYNWSARVSGNSYRISAQALSAVGSTVVVGIMVFYSVFDRLFGREGLRNYLKTSSTNNRSRLRNRALSRRPALDS